MYQLAVVGCLWLCLMLHYIWPNRSAVSPKQPPEPVPVRFKRNRTSEPKPFAVSPSWLGLGNLRANGHPSGGPWRQFYCRFCQGYFLESHGTIFHGKRLSVELIVRVLACLAEGLGIRATARVFEVNSNTVLQWLMEAADQLQAFTSSFLCDVHVAQLQLDELYAVLRGLREGRISEEQARKSLEPGCPWVWTAVDPVSKLLLTIEVGPRTVEMAQRVMHRVASALAPGCLPVCFSDGFKGYLPAIVGHFGMWIQPERLQDKGPRRKPRWMLLPGLLYAQVVKQYRRKRVVGVKHRVVFGTMEAVAQVLAACGWKINTAMVERLNLDIRQRVAAIGRRVSQYALSGRDQLAAAPGVVPCLPQFRAAPHQLMPAVGRTHPDQRHGLSQAVAAVYIRHGGRIDRPCVDAQRSVALPRPTLASPLCGVRG